jgi:succinyl-CoA synthetase beta subunit
MGSRVCNSPKDAGEAAGRMLAMRVGNFGVGEVLVEETLSISRELFLSLFIDDHAPRRRC